MRVQQRHGAHDSVSWPESRARTLVGGEHHTREIGSRDLGERHHGPGDRVGAQLHVDGVDAGGEDLHQELVSAGRGPGETVGQLQAVGGAVAEEARRSHGSLGGLGLQPQTGALRLSRGMSQSEVREHPAHDDVSEMQPGTSSLKERQVMLHFTSSTSRCLGQESNVNGHASIDELQHHGLL